MTTIEHHHVEFHRAGQPPQIISVDHDREYVSRFVRTLEFKREAGLLPFFTDGWYLVVDCDGDCGKGEVS